MREFTATERLHLKARLLTFAHDHAQFKDQEFYDADAYAIKEAEYIEHVILSGLALDSKQFQG